MTSNKQIYIMREFRNDAANHLGIPLPKGRMRFYPLIRFSPKNRCLDRRWRRVFLGAYSGA